MLQSWAQISREMVYEDTVLIDIIKIYYKLHEQTLLNSTLYLRKEFYIKIIFKPSIFKYQLPI